MKMEDLLARIKKHPDFDNAGMVLCHNGIVRGTSRDGRKVTGLKVEADHDRLDKILEKSRQRPGIVDVLVWISEGKDLMVGDDVMFIVVAGDFRENVITCLHETLNAIKSTVTSKTEYFV